MFQFIRRQHIGCYTVPDLLGVDSEYNQPKGTTRENSTRRTSFV